ncbi:winged helix DNA-binding domain-containing protein [Nocardioides sp. LHG3406-4]|uniref:winged helix DNA-binding domain-containing protein n=1 Tax=Nocardioides sp. LHG3406-4 TaxID=2804575 RepID=UPI003CF456BA
MRHVSNAERRARLVRRHAFSPAHRAADPVEATRSMTVLHATEAATVYLSIAARVDGIDPAGIDHALYADRSLVKQLAMRRTMFVAPRDLLPATWGSASARVAESERRKVGKDVVAAGWTTDPDCWLAEARRAVLDLLGDAPGGVGAAELRALVPALAGKVAIARGTKWGADVPVAPRVLTWLGARGEIVRGVNAGHWRTSRPRWTSMEAWLGACPAPLAEDDGYAELVRRWLRTFGPGTETDLVWWLGSTKTVVRRALAGIGAVEVSLDGGMTGWVLPDDLEPEPEVEPWAALLPVLDPTTMGWKQRDFYLDPQHAPFLFDTLGNGGTTAWVDGRVVGCWVQGDDGAVRVVLREDVGRDAGALLDAEADRLTRWLDGQVISSVYKSLQMKELPLP